MNNSNPSTSAEELAHTQVELKKCQEQIAGLQHELEETNRGVVALYAELDEKAAHLRTQAEILENINDAVVVTDRSFCITMWNRGAERLYGWTEAEVLGTPAREILRSELSAEARAALYRGLTEGKPALTELVQYTKDDRKLIVSGYSFPLRNPAGEITAYVAVNQDITQRKQAEIELQNYATRLERSNSDLQDFAYIASHDLQEPLRKVRSFSDQLKKMTASRLDDQELDFLDRMQNAAERMQRMVEDLLTYSRVSTQAQPHRRVDLSQVIAEVLSDLEVRIQQTHGKVEVGSLPVIEADPLQMRQVFQNLIGNALKFHQRDVPPVVKVSSRDLPENRVEITVEDNGIGFSMENSDRLFLPFHRLVGRSEYEGSGIGLSICRKIVERHSGSISVQSEPGKGSQFIIILPV